MDVWMLGRGRNAEDDLLGIFSALDDLQYRYDWVITDHGMWYGARCPEQVKKRWQWTGLLITGKELTEHLSAGYVWFSTGGVLSAVPPGTKEEAVFRYEPTWEIDCTSPDYAFQTPLTKLEIMCFAGYAWEIVCDAAFSQLVRKKLPKARAPKDFYEQCERQRTIVHGRSL